MTRVPPAAVPIRAVARVLPAALLLVLAGANAGCRCGGPPEAERSGPAAGRAVELPPGSVTGGPSALPAGPRNGAPASSAAAEITELRKDDLLAGEGAAATPGRMLTVHYTGTFLDGRKFDSSHDRNQPFQFALGKGWVIRGWDEGIEGMREGGRRRLTIPARLAYGEAGSLPDIPPRTPLVFTVELLKVE